LRIFYENIMYSKIGMKQKFVLFIIFLILSSCKEDSIPTKTDPVNPFAQKEIDWPSLQKAPWPMYRHDPQLTGRSPYAGPTKGIIGDTLPYYSTGSIVSDGMNIFIPFIRYGAPMFCSVSSQNGDTNWTLNLQASLDENPNTPMLLAGGEIVHSAKQLYGITANGLLVWQYAGTKNKIYNYHELVDKDGNIYAVEDKHTIICLSPSRQLLWSFTDPQIWQPKFSFSPDGKTLYVPKGIDHSIMALDAATQQVKWTFGSLGLFASPVVDNAGNIYFQKSSSNTPIDTFYCLAPSGAVRWQYAYHKGNSVPDIYDYYEPTIDHNGNVYFIAPKDTLVSTTNDGVLRWKLPLTPYSGSYSPLICDKNNTIFLTTGGKQLIAVSEAGTVLWQVQFTFSEGEIYFTPSIANGKLYLAANSDRFFVIE
jgi:hypothetical protein